MSIFWKRQQDKIEYKNKTAKKDNTLCTLHFRECKRVLKQLLIILIELEFLTIDSIINKVIMNLR